MNQKWTGSELKVDCKGIYKRRALAACDFLWEGSKIFFEVRFCMMTLIVDVSLTFNKCIYTWTTWIFFDANLCLPWIDIFKTLTFYNNKLPKNSTLFFSMQHAVSDKVSINFKKVTLLLLYYCVIFMRSKVPRFFLF